MDDRVRPRILVLEDEWLIADLLEAMLVELGYEVIGPASNVGEALALIQERTPDAALLDVSLRDAKSFAVADALTGRGAPFLFLTGYVRDDLPARYRDNLILRKPVTIADLKSPLEAMASHSRIAP